MVGLFYPTNGAERWERVEQLILNLSAFMRRTVQSISVDRLALPSERCRRPLQQQRTHRICVLAALAE